MPEITRPDWANYPPFVATAYDLAVQHHAGQVDKAGNPSRSGCS